jgi:hypothetical protein
MQQEHPMEIEHSGEGDPLACVCGAALADEGVGVPYRGLLMSDRDYNDLLASALVEFQALFAASTPEARAAWMTRHFGLQWRRELSDAQHLEQFLHHQIMRRSRLVYECRDCGRLWIDEGENVLGLIEYRPKRDARRLLRSPLAGGGAP